MSAPSSYYDNGSVEPMQETPAVHKKLEKRRELTSTSQRILIVLVGLPGRGKSFIGRKLHTYFRWRGSSCRVFNVGQYRRAQAKDTTAAAATGGACDSNFFDAKNETAARIRNEAALLALKDTMCWLDSVSSSSRVRCAEYNDVSVGGYSHRPPEECVAIFDATNSTKERRQMIIEYVTAPGQKPTGIVFVESICDDEELLEENFRYKVKISPDYAKMSHEDGMRDLRKRVKNYEDQYETIEDDSLSYIKVFNLSSKLMANQIYGRMSKIVVPALMAWNLGTRPIWICRAGKTQDEATKHAGSCLDAEGERFREALRTFVEREGRLFVSRRSQKLSTGTSINGHAGVRNVAGRGRLDFPCKIMCSTTPRAQQTVSWDSLAPGKVDVRSNLNPLDKGDFGGLELDEMKRKDPVWYEQFEMDPYNTRFPGGECYRDLVSRLESCLIDMEQQVAPVVVVSHVSVIRALLAYFRATSVEECASYAVPMHTVIKLTPNEGGGWTEEQIPLCYDDNNGEANSSMSRAKRQVTDINSAPVWGDNITRTSMCAS